MASVRQYICDAEIFPAHITRKYATIGGIAKTRYFAALRIQRLFRGYRVRKEIDRWNRAATVLQKYIRRWLVLWHLPQFYDEYWRWRTTTYYNQMAVRIQAVWKGYKVRKGKVPVAVLVERRLAIERLNKEIVLQMKNAFENLEKEKMEQMNKEAEEKVSFITFKLHHHLRTFNKEGIYSLHKKRKLSRVEMLFKSLRLQQYMSYLRKKYYEEIAQEPPPYPYMFSDKKMREIEDLYRNFEKTQPLKKISIPLDLYMQEKPFDLRSKPTPSPYKREMLCTEKYPPPKFTFDRPVEKSKHVAQDDFDLFVHKKCLKVMHPPPYHINHWAKKCEEHQFVD